MAAGRLSWFPELELGYYPVVAGNEPYDRAYFDRYRDQANTAIGRALMRERVRFVDSVIAGPVCDIGIGCGAFIEARDRATNEVTYGYDVNPAGFEWLEARRRFIDPHLVPQDAITCWDVLEHIPDFRSLIGNVRKVVFVSIPIFYGAAHALGSKHFRPTEHCWYFTESGLVRVFDALGFDCAARNRNEVDIGREDVMSFAFVRKGIVS